MTETPTDLFAVVRDHVLTALRDGVPELPDAVAEKVEVTPKRDPARSDTTSPAMLG